MERAWWGEQTKAISSQLEAQKQVHVDADTHAFHHQGVSEWKTFLKYPRVSKKWALFYTPFKTQHSSNIFYCDEAGQLTPNLSYSRQRWRRCVAYILCMRENRESERRRWRRGENWHE